MSAVKGRLPIIAAITVTFIVCIIMITVFADDSFKHDIKKQTQKLESTNYTNFGRNINYTRLRNNPVVRDTPEEVLTAYFAALETASNLTDKQMGAVGGTVGGGLEPYKQAYQYWSREWRDQNSFQEFLNLWQGTAHVQLLKLLPAGEEKDQKRFFVETRHLEVTADKPRSGIFYYTGFFTVGKTEEGWGITGGSLEPQNLVWQLGGHQPWRSDPVLAAVVDGLGLGLQAVVGSPVVRDNPDGTVSVIFSDDNIGEKCAIILYRPYDGMWRVLEKVAAEQ